MRVTKIAVQNFRLLQEITVNLDQQTTIIVGRNNTGKTSLTELFYKFFGRDKTRFNFEDFSVETCLKKTDAGQNFHRALALFNEYQNAILDKIPEDEITTKEQAFKDAVPKIQASIFIEYDDEDDLAALSNFIMDLDPERKDVLITCEYSITNPFYAFKDFIDNKDFECVVEFFRKKYRSYYHDAIFSIDIEDSGNKYLVEKRSEVEDVFITRFIYAQRTLDDQAADNKKNLSKGFEAYYHFNNDNNKDVESIEQSLKNTSEELDVKYQDLFKSIFEDLKTFGVNAGINLQELTIKSKLDAERVLKGNTQLFYKHHEENLLPESYNGLGFSNLIYIILQFISFYEEYSKRKPRPNFQLLFIEEPEAHFHPQMQQTFIRNINDFIKDKGWNIQIIITTHSSHIVSENGFEGIRYFDKSSPRLTVKNLSEYKAKQEKKEDSPIQFLQQYMSLKNCDMFFADKIILIEGVVERLLLPLMIKKVCPDLSSQYISVIEIGGAYAHKFKELLEFINVKTLVITDIDSVDKTDHRKACKVNPGAVSANPTLVKWLPKEEDIERLLTLESSKKEKDNIRIAYQIPESEGLPTGRSFEEAFIIKNSAVFSAIPDNLVHAKIFRANGSEEMYNATDIVANSYIIADKIKKKSDFAFDITLLDSWETPKYIEEGLIWLEK